jgi:hypothetical protein
MPKNYTPIDLKGLKTHTISRRKRMVDVSAFSKVWQKQGSLSRFIDNLPDILAGKDLRKVIAAIAEAASERKTVIFGMGAHVIKVGLNPVVIDLMERGIITALSMNGAGIIHDLELAAFGKTSEDVASSLKDGTFGMTRETAVFLSEAIRATGLRSCGLGQSVGRSIIDHSLPRQDVSILAAGVRIGVPITVHVAFGTDILHMHPDFDPKLAGAATHRDFRTFASVVSTLEGGVYVNIGSAVVLPEVFLKALTLVRNLGYRVDAFTTVNMDFIQHYRPLTNVVRRPATSGGIGIQLTGHHEIMLPLVAAGVIEQTDG